MPSLKVLSVGCLTLMFAASTAHAQESLVHDVATEPESPQSPNSMRGGAAAEVAFYSAELGSQTEGSVVFAVTGSVPLGARTYLDGRIPFGIGVEDWEDSGPTTEPFFGNVQVGAHHVLRLVPDRLWLSLGGLFVLPTTTPAANRGLERLLTAPRGFWDSQDFLVWPLGVKTSLQLEGKAGSYVSLRGVLDAILIPQLTEREGDLRFILQHAAEVFFGQEIGGGLRVQGVFVPTEKNDYADTYRAQFALEPYAAYEGNLFRARLGLMIPLTEPLGPPFVEGWGLRFSGGVVVD
ncbi:MAG: hypothetical protein U0271_21255 [Polyangiaceae bacterium]